METQEKKFVPASKQIPTVNSGWLDRELGEAMSEAVRACLAHGKQSEITVKLKIQPQNIQSGTVKISHDVATNCPKKNAKAASSLLHLTATSKPTIRHKEN